MDKFKNMLYDDTLKSKFKYAMPSVWADQYHRCKLRGAGSGTLSQVGQRILVLWR